MASAVRLSEGIGGCLSDVSTRNVAARSTSFGGNKAHRSSIVFSGSSNACTIWTSFGNFFATSSSRRNVFSPPQHTTPLVLQITFTSLPEKRGGQKVQNREERAGLERGVLSGAKTAGPPGVRRVQKGDAVLQRHQEDLRRFQGVPVEGRSAVGRVRARGGETAGFVADGGVLRWSFGASAERTYVVRPRADGVGGRWMYVTLRCEAAP